MMKRLQRNEENSELSPSTLYHHDLREAFTDEELDQCDVLRKHSIVQGGAAELVPCVAWYTSLDKNLCNLKKHTS